MGSGLMDKHHVLKLWAQHPALKTSRMWEMTSGAKWLRPWPVIIRNPFYVVMQSMLSLN
jgi:hypothetical protein